MSQPPSYTGRLFIFYFFYYPVSCIAIQRNVEWFTFKQYSRLRATVMLASPTFALKAMNCNLILYYGSILLFFFFIIFKLFQMSRDCVIIQNMVASCYAEMLTIFN